MSVLSVFLILELRQGVMIPHMFSSHAVVSPYLRYVLSTEEMVESSKGWYMKWTYLLSSNGCNVIL